MCNKNVLSQAQNTACHFRDWFRVQILQGARLLKPLCWQSPWVSFFFHKPQISHFLKMSGSVFQVFCCYQRGDVSVLLSCTGHWPGPEQHPSLWHTAAGPAMVPEAPGMQGWVSAALWVQKEGENSPMHTQNQGADPHPPQQFPKHRSAWKWEPGLCQFKKDVHASLQICRGNGCIILLLILLGDGNHMVPWGYTTLDAALVHLKMPEVPEALPLAPVGVKQGRNAEGKVPLETFLTLYLKSIGLFLRIEKKIKKRGNQLKPLHKLWLIATTPACHSRNSVKLVFKVDMLRVFFCLGAFWGFL